MSPFCARARVKNGIIEVRRDNAIRQLECRVVWLLSLVCIFMLTACNTTKFVPEDKYLLNNVTVKINDTKDVLVDDLMTYVQQKENSEVLGFWKLQLAIYNTAPKDTTTKAKKRAAKNAHRMGEAPVIYSPEMTRNTSAQLKRAMNNKGYYRAQVDTVVVVKDRKVDLKYLITAHSPYILRTYTVDVHNGDLSSLANEYRNSLISNGMVFDGDLLNQERKRVASAMRRRGYFFFDQEYLQYDADSTKGNQQVDVTMRLQDYVLDKDFYSKVFRKYTIRKVCFHLDYDPKRMPKGEEIFSSSYDGYEFTWVGKKGLRDKVLMRHCPIAPNAPYNEHTVERAYTKLNRLSAVKYVDISFDQVGDNELDCHVVISRGKENSISAELEGTYSVGDWGVAAGLGYTNRNLFHGSEELALDGRASYEWRQNGGRAIEGKANANLRFPSNVSFDLGYNYQNRPDEYTRSIFNAGLDYTIAQPRQGLNHQFRFVDISYVYLPWISDAFRDQFLQSTNILKYSYENHFIVGWGYSGNYTSFRARYPHRSYWNLYYNVETAGNLLRGVAKPLKFEVDPESGNYMLFKTQFSQFAKADFSVTYNQIFNPRHRVVYHADLGVAVPYGNSMTIPVEKRYFGGGANSNRGWAARTLGPGGYRGSGKQIDFNNQSGDIRLNLNLEYRVKVWWVFELAAFVDAGNIWTIYDYESQPDGVFKWTEFYKQIALAYGVGVRMDFDFFIFRVDFGVKLYDPSRRYDGSGAQWRTAGNGLNWTDDMALHFAIGYPF